jgi:hypothetical protein
LVCDILIKNGADELRFVVEFQIEGKWTRFMELTCTRSVAGHQGRDVPAGAL